MVSSPSLPLTPRSFSAWELQKERRTSATPAASPAQGQMCLHSPTLWERIQEQWKGPWWGQDRGAARAMAPSELPEQQLSPCPAGDQKVTRGCKTWKCPHQLPAGGGRDHSQGGVCVAGNLSCPTMGCNITTDPEVAPQELVDQMRMTEVPSSSLPSSCSSSSSATASFLLPSTHSWPRVKQSCGCREVLGCREERQAVSCRWPP